MITAIVLTLALAVTPTPAEELADRVALLEEQLAEAKLEIARLELQTDSCRASLATMADESRSALESCEGVQEVQEREIRRLRYASKGKWWKPLLAGAAGGYILNDALD